MNATTKLFWILSVFFPVLGVIYTLWAMADSEVHRVEWVGTVGLFLTGILCVLIGFYVSRVYKAQGTELPEDRRDANIDDGEAEQGFFSPWSWWPVLLAGSAALVFLGVAIGPWIAIIGGVLALISLVGLIFEYQRGYFAH